jgi:hypothetical protein
MEVICLGINYTSWFGFSPWTFTKYRQLHEKCIVWFDTRGYSAIVSSSSESKLDGYCAGKGEAKDPPSIRTHIAALKHYPIRATN